MKVHPAFYVRLPDDGATPPQVFSYSLLHQLETCPRQWWLFASSYKDLPKGYPVPVYPVSVTGTIVHRTLHDFSTALKRAGNPHPSSTLFHEVRRRFPLRQRVQHFRDVELAGIKQNPRADLALISGRVSVNDCINSFKRLVQEANSLDSDVEVSERIDGKSAQPGAEWESIADHNYLPSSESSLAHLDLQSPVDLILSVPASLSEVQIWLSNPPIRGILDLVRVEDDGDILIEYKSGRPRPEHAEQARMYTLLWFLQTGRMPKGCYLIYSQFSSVRLPSMTERELKEQLALTISRIEKAQATLAEPVPSAYPQNNRCRFCQVRQLCDPYWSSSHTQPNRWKLDEVVTTLDGAPVAEWRDLEINLIEPRALRDGFVGRVATEVPCASHSKPISIFCPVPAKFHPERINQFSRVRVMGGGIKREGNNLQVILSPFSELFWCATKSSI